MSKPYILVVYNFSPLDDSVERLKFDSEAEMSEYVSENIKAGESCLYYPESSLPFKNGWDELLNSSHAVFN